MGTLFNAEFGNNKNYRVDIGEQLRDWGETTSYDNIRNFLVENFDVKEEEAQVGVELNSFFKNIEPKFKEFKKAIKEGKEKEALKGVDNMLNLYNLTSNIESFFFELNQNATLNTEEFLKQKVVYNNEYEVTKDNIEEFKKTTKDNYNKCKEYKEKMEEILASFTDYIAHLINEHIEETNQIFMDFIESNAFYEKIDEIVKDLTTFEGSNLSRGKRLKKFSKIEEKLLHLSTMAKSVCDYFNRLYMETEEDSDEGMEIQEILFEALYRLYVTSDVYAVMNAVKEQL